MIKKIFLPEFFNNKRIFSQTILGFYIENKKITCAKIFASKTKTVLEKLFIENIENNIIQTIKKIIYSSGNFDQVYVSIPSTSIVFKEITLPFIEEEKIRMVLDYEIEGMLPFSIDESVIDFIITKQDTKNKKSQILVAAIRNKDLEEILDLYKKAGIEPTKISLDIFAIYSLYQQIPEYNPSPIHLRQGFGGHGLRTTGKKLQEASAIINLNDNHIQISFLENGQLRLARILPKGINTIIKNISKQANQSIKIIKENLLKFGFQKIQDNQYNKSLEQNMIDLFNEIQFTLNSFSLKLNLEQNISKILFTGPYSQLKNLTSYSKNLLQIPCELFSCEKLFSDSNFVNKAKRVDNLAEFTIALGTGIVAPQLRNFNLRRKEFKIPQDILVKKQIITSLVIIFIIFTTIIGRGYFQITKLSNQIKSVENIQTNQLRKIFPKDINLPKKINLKNLVNRAEREVSEKLEMWSPFEKDQIKPLIILQELTNIIDKRRFDVTIDSILITEEDEKAKVEVEGFFKSKTKSNHFKYFAELEKRFARSKILEPWDKEEIESRLEEDKGIRFSVKLKLKDQE